MRLAKHVVAVASVGPHMFDHVARYPFPFVGPIAGVAPGLVRQEHVDPSRRRTPGS